MKFAQTIVTLIIALHMLATVAEAAPRQAWQKTPRQQQTAAHDSQPELDPLLMPEDLSVFGESRMPPYICRSPEFWESDRQEIMELAKKVIYDLPSPYKELVERELQKTDYRNPPNFYYVDDSSRVGCLASFVWGCRRSAGSFRGGAQPPLSIGYPQILSKTLIIKDACVAVRGKLRLFPDPRIRQILITLGGWKGRFS